MSIETLEQKFQKARARILAGEQLTVEEQKELIAALRQQRFTAAESSAKSRTKKAEAKASISDADLDAQLGDLGL